MVSVQRNITTAHNITPYYINSYQLALFPCVGRPLCLYSWHHIAVMLRTYFTMSTDIRAYVLITDGCQS
jgi:hypothetical protein